MELVVGSFLLAIVSEVDDELSGPTYNEDISTFTGPYLYILGHQWFPVNHARTVDISSMGK